MTTLEIVLGVTNLATLVATPIIGRLWQKGDTESSETKTELRQLDARADTHGTRIVVLEAQFTMLTTMFQRTDQRMERIENHIARRGGESA